MRGLSAGLPFALKMFFTASSSNIFAPIPYTVSVGKATSPPALMMFAASFTEHSSVLNIFVLI